MDCSTPGLPVLHLLLQSTQTHVHWVGDAIQPSHPLSSPSPPDFNLSQHQGLLKWFRSSHQVAKVLDFQLQRQSAPVCTSLRWKFCTNAHPPSHLYPRPCIWLSLSYILHNKIAMKVYAFLSLWLLDCGRVCREGGMRLSKFIIQPGRSGGKLGTPFAASICNGSSLVGLSP